MFKQPRTARLIGALSAFLFIVMVASSPSRACCPEVSVSLGGGQTLLACGTTTVSADAEPSGGTYAWTCTGAGSISGSGSSVTFTGSATGGHATVKVRYTFECNGVLGPTEVTVSDVVHMTVVAVANISPDERQIIVGGTTTFYVQTNPEAYYDMVTVSKVGPFGVTYFTGTGTIQVLGESTAGIGTITATAGCSTATAKVVVIDLKITPGSPQFECSFAFNENYQGEGAPDAYLDASLRIQEQGAFSMNLAQLAVDARFM